ncbi:unnamed protein product (macronuclear) [Paramecium tetraurelia]|uniref:Transmembrane protein n=1 Tax=Paramecium tetraurelia TaxID=5888 RepID=A0DL29_PARTE|nr:uncharacterized protein GSPATT00018063001 [Paramecium tetraurelia]CAK83746.1 unnamed protein product [Paramecium tetraurelia]|eukprot:XP_001451143.1 hypothetical protein (macronuclear) [Paramecium tetraurelia strain d4-2]
MSYIIFNIVFCGLQVMAEDTYNFPLQSNQPNIIYLEDYTPDKFQAPLYQLERDNEYNLNIQQSALSLQQGQFNLNGKILSASNYISESQLSSNDFWVLTQSNLYQGLLQNNGSLTLNQVPFNFTQLSCFYINLVTENMGMISCLQKKYLNFVLINLSNYSHQIYETNVTFPKKFSNRKINLQYFNQSAFNIYLTYLTKDNATAISFSYNLKQLDYASEQVYNGTFIQIVLSQDFNFLFLMSKKSLYFINLSTQSSFKEIANYKMTTPRIREHFSQMAVYQLSKNIYHVVLLQNEYLSQLYYDFNSNIQTENHKHFVLNAYKKIIQLEVNVNSIYVVTNNYVTKLNSISSIKPTNYYNYSLTSMALIMNERQIAILFDTSEQSTKFESMLFNKPQILVNVYQTQLMVSNLQAVKIKIKIFSQIQRQIEHTFLLNIIMSDISQSQCPVQFSNNFPNANLVYPIETTVKGNTMTLGPNITTTITNSDKQYLTFQKSKINKYLSDSNETYSAMCSIYRSQIITCAQFEDEVRIQYSDSLQLTKTSTYFVVPINFNQNLVQCTCSQTFFQIEVLMQFQTQILIQTIDYQLFQQGLYQYSFSQGILSSAFLDETLFVITTDNNLSAYSKNNNKNPKFTVQNYQFNQIYLNKQNYPNYLFIDNQQSLVILSYNGQSSCQFVNQIPYPLLSYEQLKLGILNTGIFIAIINNQRNTQLYYYPIQSVYIDSPIQSYYELNLLGYQFAFSQLQTGYTQHNFYIILYKSTSVYWAQYQGSGSSFFSLFQSNWIQAISSSNYISSLSVIEFEQGKQILEYLQIINTKTEFKKYVITDWSVELTPLYRAGDLAVQTQVTYNASNMLCYSLQQQDVTILYDKKVILPQIQGLEKKTIELTVNQSQFEVNPLEFFNGNVDNYTATCKNCQQFNFTQPVSQQNQVLLGQYLQGLISLNETFLYVQNNLSVFLLEQSTGQLTKLYDFPKRAQFCYNLFVEIVTQFPISICSNSIIYSYNMTSKTIMQYDLSNLVTLYLKFYNNGILQIISQTNIYHNYNQYYLQIIDDEIILTQIYTYARFQQTSQIDQVIVKLSSNFTSDPCQILGFQNQIAENLNPKFYLLKTCMPSSIAQYFGFPGNQYTNVTNLYFLIQDWMLTQTQVVSVSVSKYMQQVGSPKPISDQVNQILIACPYTDNVRVYRIQFNLTNGRIIGYQFSGSLFLDFSSQYSLNCANNVIFLHNVSVISQNQSQNLYIYNVEHLFYSNLQIVPYISYMPNIFSSSKVLFQVNGNNLLFSGFQESRSIIITIQNDLRFNVSVQESEQAEIEILALNQQSQCQRSLFVMDEQNDDNNDDDDDDNNDDDDDNNDDDNNNDDNDDNDDDDIDNPNQKSKSSLIIIVSASVLLLIIIIFIIVIYCRRKEVQKQNKEMSYQLV